MKPKRIDKDAIEARMLEMGYNQHSLSMLATGKPDTLRNLFSGKSKTLRGDTLQKVSEILWPDQEAADRDVLLGIASALEGLVQVLVARNAVKADDLLLVFARQLQKHRVRNQPNAAEVLAQLIASLGSEVPASAAQTAAQP